VVSVFCDLTRAFDNSNHDLLLQKLGYYGVRGNILKWFKTYLYNKKKRVVLQNCNSANTGHMILYAADTTIAVTSDNINTLNEKLSIVINYIPNWFQNNCLVFNLKKKNNLINFITLKASEYTLSVTYNNLGIKVDNNVTFLGMYVDPHLNWNLHTAKLKKKK
jgi:hypothetical protein